MHHSIPSPLLLQVGGGGKICVQYKPAVSGKTFQTQSKTQVVKCGQGGLPVPFGPEPADRSIGIIQVKNGYSNRIIDGWSIFDRYAGVTDNGFDSG